MENIRCEKVETNGEIGRILREEILNQYCTDYILYGEDPTCVGEPYFEFADAIRNFEVREDDIWVASYPKSGTTWTQEMVWLIANSLDYEAAKAPLGKRFPFFEGSTISNREEIGKVLGLKEEFFHNSVEFCNKERSPRFLKTHLPVSLLPAEFFYPTKLPKTIYVWRNPKDVCVSYYHHGNLLQGWRTKLENFSKVFLADRAQYGSFWKHVLGYWNMQDFGNVLIINYEAMKADLPQVIVDIAYFLDKPINDQQIDVLSEHLSFETMKKNKALNAEEFVENLKKHNLVFEDGSFLRSGTVGKYKEELSPETVKKFDEWIKESISGTSFEEAYNYNL